MTDNKLLSEEKTDCPLFIYLPFFANIAWLAKAQKAGKVVVDLNAPFVRQTYRNRVSLMSSNGLQNISVPIKREKNGPTRFKDVEICYKENWNIRLWRAIYSNYGKSPYYEYFYRQIYELLTRQYKYLWELNLETFEFLKKSFALECELSFEEGKEKTLQRNNETFFTPKSRLKDLVLYEPYIQCFDEKIDFEPNLSALDLLMCEGKQEGKAYLCRVKTL